MLRLAGGLAPAVLIAPAMAVASESAASLGGASPWYEGFEGGSPSWQAVGGDAPCRVLAHRRSDGDAHTGRRCEVLSIECGPGKAVYYLHPVGPARVIEELLPTVWIRADRPGVHLLARIVLPRSIDSRTGRPVSLLVDGSYYSLAGQWQQLRIDQLSEALARQVRAARAQWTVPLDAREAILDAVVLNVHVGQGRTEIAIDDLDLSGYVRADVSAPAAGAAPSGAARWTPVGSGRPSAGEMARVTPNGFPAPAADVQRQDAPRLVGTTLTVSGQPLFPRLIQYQGEPLDLLARLGFNGIWLGDVPSPALLNEARRTGMWIVCPPPVAMRVPGQPPSVGPSSLIDEAFSPVLAWNLGLELSRRELEATAAWAEDVRGADRRAGRPLVCQAQTNLREYSRQVDLLLADRRPIGSTLELADYADWLAAQPRLARPGTPFWTTVQTQPSRALREQCAALGPAEGIPNVLPAEQVRLLAHLAIAAGSRALVFLSDTPLTAQDADTLHRAAVLQLVNLELSLLERWAAAGNYVTSADSTEAAVRAAVFRTDRSRLVLPVWLAPGAQWVVPLSAAEAFSLVVPGAPESVSTFDLGSAGMHALRHQRVAGGTQVRFEQFELCGAVLLAQDPLVFDAVRRSAAAIAPGLARLQHRVATDRLAMVEKVFLQFGSRWPPHPRREEYLGGARRELQSGQRLLSSGDHAGAFAAGQRAMRWLRPVQRDAWEAAIAQDATPRASPMAGSFATLPWHGRLVDRLRAARPSGNRLVGGDFEQFGALIDSGWQHYQQPVEGLWVGAGLSVDAAHGGRSGLRLAVQPAAPKESHNAESASPAPAPDSLVGGTAPAPATVESPPLWITSAGAPVEAGALVAIHGWVCVPRPLVGSVDGLLIFDNLGGYDLAERFRSTDGWRRFVLYRVATQSGNVNVTFALGGIGEAWIDDVAIEVLETPVATSPGA